MIHPVERYYLVVAENGFYKILSHKPDDCVLKFSKVYVANKEITIPVIEAWDKAGFSHPLFCRITE